MTRSYIKKNFDRSISSSSRKQFLWLLLIIVAFFVIPFVGFGFFHALPFSVYIIGEEDDIDHDTLNINCLELIKDKYKSIDCHVFLKDQTAYSLLKTDDKYKSEGNIKLSLFGYCEEWAREVLVYHSTNKNYPYLDRDGIGIDSPKHVHFVINGMTQMGMTMAIEACHIAHFQNFIKNNKLRTKITMIDKDAITKMEHLVAVYSNFFKQIRYSYSVIEHGKLIYTKHDVADVGDNSFIDIEFEFLEGSIFDSGIREFISYLADNENTILTFASCLDDSYQNLDVCLHLPENLYYRDDIAIFTQQETAAKLLDIVNDNDNPCKKYKNVFPFGMVDYDYCGIKDYWGKAEQINYEYQENKSKTPDEYWNDCSEIKRLSSLYCALYKQTQVRSDFVIDGNKCASDSGSELYKDETEHNRWNVEKLLMGFRPVTSEEASDIEKDIFNGSKEKKKDFYKEHYYAHYDIRPYSELGKETKEIDTRVNSVK